MLDPPAVYYTVGHTKIAADFSKATKSDVRPTAQADVEILRRFAIIIGSTLLHVVRIQGAVAKW
jgi:hypothetical protein